MYHTFHAHAVSWSCILLLCDFCVCVCERESVWMYVCPPYSYHPILRMRKLHSCQGHHKVGGVYLYYGVGLRILCSKFSSLLCTLNLYLVVMLERQLIILRAIYMYKNKANTSLVPRPPHPFNRDFALRREAWGRLGTRLGQHHNNTAFKN